jgi:hypothetical protein
LTLAIVGKGDAVDEEIGSERASKGNDAREICRDTNLSRAWKLSDVTAILALLGVAIYGILWIAYVFFYSRLGVSPSDVGLTYATILSQSVGFVLFLALASILVSIGILIISQDARTGEPVGIVERVGMVRTGVVIAMTVVLIFVLPVIAEANAKALQVRRGQAVAPYTLLGIAVLAIHADPVIVQPIGKRTENPAVDELTGRSLLYLGQANGMLVLYEPGDAQHAIYVPNSTVVMTVLNCAANGTRYSDGHLLPPCAP